MSGINADWNGTSIDKLYLTAAWLARLMAEAAQARQALLTLAITLERREPDATTPATPGDGAGVSRDVNLMTAETSATIVKLCPDAAPATGSASTKAKPEPAKATRSMSAKDWQSFRSQVRAEMKARGLDHAGLAQAVGLAKSTVEAALGRTKPPRDAPLAHFQKWLAGGDRAGPPRQRRFRVRRSPPRRCSSAQLRRSQRNPTQRRPMASCSIWSDWPKACGASCTRRI